MDEREKDSMLTIVSQTCHKIEFSLVENLQGLATKHFSVDQAGHLVKKAGGQIAQGVATRVRIDRLADLPDFLGSVSTSQAVCWGLVNRDGDESPLRTKSSRQPGDVARCKEDFTWSAGPGILMLDFDVPAGVVTTLEAFTTKLFKCVPQLEKFDRVEALSCSSFVEWAGGSTGFRGCRLYFLVAIACTVPQIGNLIFDRLWANDEGYCVVSTAGSLLDRALVDASVWQPERFDFVARASLAEGLTQGGDSARFVAGEKTTLTLADLPPITATEVTIKKEKKEAERLRLAEEIAAKKGALVSERAAERVKQTGESLEAARAACLREIERSELASWCVLSLQSGEAVTVAQVLKEKSKYHGRRCLDPIEPDHRGGDDFCGVLLLLNGRPVLSSLAHGKTVYKLVDDKIEIRLGAGDLANFNEEIANALLKNESMCRNQAGELSLVEDGKLLKVTEYRLCEELVTVAKLTKLSRRDDEGNPIYTAVDMTTQQAKMFLHSDQVRRFPQVVGLVDHTVITAAGRLVRLPGYDEGSGLFLTGAVEYNLPTDLTEEAARQAGRRLLALLREFRFSTSVDKSVAFAGLLCAVLRPVMKTAPLLIFSAPVAGSGKTYLASVLGALAQGFEPSVYPADTATNQEEFNKYLSSVIRVGTQVILLDNWPTAQAFGGAGLDAVLTSGRVTGRILGQSSTFDGRANFLAMLTGNNISIKADARRRVLFCVIDPACENPELRSFKTNLMGQVLVERERIIGDVLTVVLACLRSVNRPSALPLGSFEDWDRLVRQPVQWLAGLGLDLVDPVEAQKFGAAQDLERQADLDLLCALTDVQEVELPGKTWTAGEMIQRALDARRTETELLRSEQSAPSLRRFREGEGRLRLALWDALGAGADAGAGKHALSKHLAQSLRKLMDRHFAGHVLRCKGERRRAKVYTVETTQAV